MVGTMKIEVGKKKYEIKANWRTAELIAERFVDPLTFVEDFAKGQVLGTESKPALEFNLVNTIGILFCGLEGAGHDVEIDDLGDTYMGARLPEATNLALQFMFMFSSDAALMFEEGAEAGDGDGKK